MTIEQSILSRLAYGSDTSNGLQFGAMWDVSPTPFRHSVRARLSRLVKSGKIICIGQATYALPKKVRRRKTPLVA